MNTHIPQITPSWEKKYEIGIEEIDFQHKYFLQLIKRFQEKISQDMPPLVIEPHIKEIIYYMKFHFCSEENLMRLFKYPNLDTHKKKHLEIVNEVNNKTNLFLIGAIKLNEITDMLVKWFQDHTIEEDSEIGEFYKSLSL